MILFYYTVKDTIFFNVIMIMLVITPESTTEHGMDIEVDNDFYRRASRSVANNSFSSKVAKRRRRFLFRARQSLYCVNN